MADLILASVAGTHSNGASGMSFQEHLQLMASQVDALIGVAISDMDGIIVDEYKTDPSLDMAMLAAEYGRLWSVADQAGNACELGATEECCVSNEKFNLVIRKISADYFLLMTISPERGFGKGRFYAKMSVASLLEEIEV